jgi:hypothetical protein
MSLDMGISRFSGETDDSFAYRVLFSALGQWCLRTALDTKDNVTGTTKHNQTIVLNDLLDKYSIIFPSVADKFIDASGQHSDFSVFIRRLYEETGYLLIGEDNRNKLANYGRSILFGDKALFFGIPDAAYTVKGLGIFTQLTDYSVSSREFLIRDNLSYEEYFCSCFDYIDFYNKDLNLGAIEFFNPLSTNAPSRSWEKEPVTDCTIARKSVSGPFYRAMNISGVWNFADEPIEQQSDSFTSYEYRRLYFAMKAHYGAALKATITQIDKDYSAIRIGGHLPNREYYFILLLSWPMNGAFDKVSFLALNDTLVEIVDILENIGIKVEGGDITDAKLKWRSAILQGYSGQA